MSAWLRNSISRAAGLESVPRRTRSGLMSVAGANVLVAVTVCVVSVVTMFVGVTERSKNTQTRSLLANGLAVLAVTGVRTALL